MTFYRPLGAATAVALLLSGTPAQAHSTDTEGLLRLLQRIAAQYSILVSRSFVDLTYDSLTIEPGTNNMSLTGVKVFPILEWDQAGECAISIERIATGDITSFSRLETNIQVSGVTVPSVCFDPQVGGMLGGFGYNEINADTVSFTIGYDLPSSAADIAINASVTDAADISVSGVFDYLWFNIPLDGYGDPEPVAYLGEAEVIIENKGLWERLEPMVAAQMGDVNAIPQMAQGMLGDMLTEGGTKTPSAQEQAFVEQLSAELARFLTEKNRLVVTIAPENSVLLSPDIMDGPGTVIAALNPQVSAVPVALRRIIQPSELSAALSGGALDDEAKLRVGKALITGLGAPRTPAAGIDLLKSLAEGWNAEAAYLTAQAKSEAGDHKGAYDMALRALAGGETRAIALADAAELELSVADILAAQDAVGNAWPGGDEVEAAFTAMTGEGDIGGIRRMARSALVGSNMPRYYQAAYFLGSLAAAAGDRSGADIRTRLDQRFGSDPAWQTAAGEAAAEALSVWTEGLGATIAGQAQ